MRNCNDPDATRRIKFEQPVLQTAQMFVGELGCFVVAGLLALYRRYVAKSSASQRGYEAISTNDHDADISPEDDEQQDPESNANAHKRGYTILLLALPAICDICGTTLINTGLIFVAASIFQMTRGALVLFVGLFSVLFLKRHLKLFQWLALVGVVLGVVIVGLAGAIWPDEKAATSGGTDNLPQDNGGLTPAVKVVIGVLLIAGAQILTATQFVLEEWILENSPIEPIMVVGWEGTYGLVITVILMIVMHFLVGQTEAGQYGYFDMKEGWRQMTTDNRIWVSSLLIMVSIGYVGLSPQRASFNFPLANLGHQYSGFNFFGLSVTRSVSATSRSTIDTCRTLFIWMISLGLGWETFKWLQILGFAFLVYSTFLFNGIVQPPLKCLQTNEEVEELLPEEPIENYR